MTDKEQEELATALVLVFGNRSPDEVAAAILAYAGDNFWPLQRSLDKLTHTVPVYSMSVAYLRERLAEGYVGDGPERFKESVSDEELYAELDTLDIPGGIYETMGYVMDDLYDEFRKKDLIEDIPPEVTEDVPRPQNVWP